MNFNKQSALSRSRQPGRENRPINAVLLTFVKGTGTRKKTRGATGQCEPLPTITAMNYVALHTPPSMHKKSDKILNKLIITKKSQFTYHSTAEH